MLLLFLRRPPQRKDAAALLAAGPEDPPSFSAGVGARSLLVAAPVPDTVVAPETGATPPETGADRTALSPPEKAAVACTTLRAVLHEFAFGETEGRMLALLPAPPSRPGTQLIAPGENARR